MIDYLSDKLGVIAFKSSGEFTIEEMSELYNNVEASLEGEGKVHVYCEIDEYLAMNVDALIHDLPRAFNLIRQRGRFGRIAVVCEDALIRHVAQFESVILPNISYHTFTKAQRNTALAWVEGRDTLPFGHTLSVIETDDHDTAAFELDGKLGAKEMAALMDELDNIRRDHPRRKLLLRMKSYAGFEPSGLFNSHHLKMKLAMLRELDQYAVVGAPKWIERYVKLLNPLLKVDIRCFELDEEQAAWIWLKAKPLLERPLVDDEILAA